MQECVSKCNSDISLWLRKPIIWDKPILYNLMIARIRYSLFTQIFSTRHLCCIYIFIVDGWSPIFKLKYHTENYMIAKSKWVHSFRREYVSWRSCLIGRIIIMRDRIFGTLEVCANSFRLCLCENIPIVWKHCL